MSLTTTLSALTIFLFINALIVLSACKDKYHDSNESSSGGNNVTVDRTSQDMPVRYVASILPLKMILDELSKGRAEVYCFMKPGVSPHTFEPKPSDLSKAANATAFFFVSDNLEGWAVNVDAESKISVIEFLPKHEYVYYDDQHIHDHNESNAHEPHSSTLNSYEDKTASVIDPHFWTSPQAVLSVVPALTSKLVELDPPGAEVYERNSGEFTKDLLELDNRIQVKLDRHKGESVILFHASFLYLLRDYSLNLAGVIEPSPGKEPTPKEITKLKKLALDNNVKALFSEPQLSRNAAEVLASESDLLLFELDPLGGDKHRTSYIALIEFNVDVLLEAFSSDGSTIHSR